ncbi:MAG: thioredoxin-dependent thiol peroxidase [Fimbriimonadaceae bacterium]|jgi:peroxiredoxin Q/BCP|nr:thioredoxin-dependent thiol peroxidase [Fimbriimonadaceae bacterium]
MLTLGQDFPSFELPDQDGNLKTLADFSGSPFIVYFYPKDDTSGCTTEACEFRDSFPSFSGANVIGVSPDSVKSHKKFVDKYSLPFILLADTDQALSREAGVWVEKSMYGKKYMGVERTTFLVGSDGKVLKVWNKVKPAGHAAEVLAALTSA